MASRPPELRRRPADVSIHDWHHRLVDHDIAAYEALPKRNVGYAVARRETYKTAVWTLVGHLRQEHGWRGLSAFLSLDDLVELHRRYHEGAVR